jgi:hypothetical protein
MRQPRIANAANLRRKKLPQNNTGSHWPLTAGAGKHGIRLNRIWRPNYQTE